MTQEAAHTPRLGTINIGESTGVQYCEHTADLIKTVGVTASTKLENPAYIVNSVNIEQNVPIVAQKAAHTPRLGAQNIDEKYKWTVS